MSNSDDRDICWPPSSFPMVGEVVLACTGTAGEGSECCTFADRLQISAGRVTLDGHVREVTTSSGPIAVRAP